jgi:hypothetical protein
MKSKLTGFVVIYLAALLLALVLGNVDYEFAKRTGRTCLSIPIAYYSDGGSREYLGFGYTLLLRHKIDHREDDHTVYLVGPELKAWNVFQVFGARKLFERDYGDEVYYRDREHTDRVLRGSVTGDMMDQKIHEAITDLLPSVVILGLFGAWRLIARRKQIPTMRSSEPPSAGAAGGRSP